MENKITPELCGYLNQLSKRPHLTTSMIRDHIYAFLAKKKRRRKTTHQSNTKLDLSAYGRIKADKEVTYDIL